MQPSGDFPYSFLTSLIDARKSGISCQQLSRDQGPGRGRWRHPAHVEIERQEKLQENILDFRRWQYTGVAEYAADAPELYLFDYESSAKVVDEPLSMQRAIAD